MAKRMIDTDLWSDSKIMDNFTPEDKYFWLFLLTTRYANMCGVFEVSIKQISRDLGYDEDAVKHLINRFKNIHQLIDYDFDTKEIFIFNWYKYNWSNSIYTIKHVEKFIDMVKSEVFKENISKVLNEYVENKGSLRGRIGDTISISTTNTITNTIKDKDIDINTNGKVSGNKGGKINPLKETHYDNETIQNLFIEYLELRKKNKLSLSPTVITRLKNKLEPHNDKLKQEMLENAIMGNWKDLYPVNNFNNKNDNKVRQGETHKMTDPHWLQYETE